MDQSSGPTTNEAHEDVSSPVAPQQPVRRKLTWREARRKRRKARRRGEEILAWILVPVIVIGIWLGISATLEFFGTTPGQVFDQLQQVKQALEKRSQTK